MFTTMTTDYNEPQVRDWNWAIRQCLRPSEQLRAVIDTLSDEEQPVPSPESDYTARRVYDARKRILAIVSHDEPEGEQGSVLVFKVVHSTHELRVQHMFPICGDITITISQPEMNRKAAWAVVINPGVNQGVEPLTLLVLYNEYDAIKKVVNECRRLKDLSDKQATVKSAQQALQTYSWLAPYVSQRAPPPSPSSAQVDIRTAQAPLHERLSKATAGMPGDDLYDILAIRDEWILQKARENTKKEKHKLRIRIGTFNVNDKPPSQDLSSWVSNSKSTTFRTVIPPIQNLSPLSLGEVARDPLESKMREMDLNASRDSIASSSITAIEPSSPPLGKPRNVVPGEDKDVKQTNDSRPSIYDDLRRNNRNDEEGFSEEDPDLLVFGMQELDLSTEALIYSTTTLKADAWCLGISAALGEKGEMYEKLISKQLVGMFMVIFVKKSMKLRFQDPKTTSAGVGIMGLMGNKGAVAIQLRYVPESDPDGTKCEPVLLTFVNSHLAAFDEMYEKRNADYQDLCRKLWFSTSVASKPTVGNVGGGSAGVDGLPKSGEKSNRGSISEGTPVVPDTVTELRSGLFVGDVLFWMGGKITSHGRKREIANTGFGLLSLDLNYRIDLADVDVRSVLADDHWPNKNEVLLRYDQLKKAIREGHAFRGFSEFPITHQPTYRYSPGILTDKLGYDMKRKPAWTDRILHMASPYCNVTQHSYRGYPGITMSDHRPVSADFSLEFDTLDSDEFEHHIHTFYREVMSMDDEGGRERPILALKNAKVDFGTLEYSTSRTMTCVIKNTGKIPAAFRLISAGGGKSIVPPWVTVEPLAGLIKPKESIEIKFHVSVDNAVAATLNKGARSVSEDVILHTAFGKDHFVTLSYQWNHTCFATNLYHLIRIRESARKEGGAYWNSDRSVVNSPKEIMRLINWLMSDNVPKGGLFTKQVDVNEKMVHTIRECLDTRDEFPYKNTDADTVQPEVAHAFAETLLRFLASMTEPIVPYSLHTRCTQMTSRDEAFEVLDVFPSESVNTWISLTAFLHYICQQSENPDVEATRIASIFAPILLRDDPQQDLPVSPVKKREFMIYFLM